MAECGEVADSPDVHFEPIIKLKSVEVKNMEENEEEIFKMRSKLFRFDTEADPPEWKERGTGDLKFLRHKITHNIRLLMRRDKTHKICANHFLTPNIKLLPCAGSDRAWVYTVNADFADEEPKVEQLAIRFKNAENANKFKDKFEECQENFTNVSSSDSSDKLADDLGKLNVEGCGENGELETPLTDSTEGQEKVASQLDKAGPSTKLSTESSSDTAKPSTKLSTESSTDTAEPSTKLSTESSTDTESASKTDS